MFLYFEFQKKKEKTSQFYQKVLSKKVVKFLFSDSKNEIYDQNKNASKTLIKIERERERDEIIKPRRI